MNRAEQDEAARRAELIRYRSWTHQVCPRCSGAGRRNRERRPCRRCEGDGICAKRWWSFLTAQREHIR